MSFTSRVKSLFGFGGAEGSFRGPFNGTGELGGSYAMGNLDDGWQTNLNPRAGSDKVAIAYACAMLNARALSQCEAKHIVEQEDGGFVKSKTSPASRILRKPNDYETLPQLVTNVVSDMMFEGESILIAVRDDRYAIKSVHRIPRHSWTIHHEKSSQQYFYQVSSSGDMFTKPDMLIPSRDVAHFRMHSPSHPMVGITPLKAAAMAMGLQVALNRSQLAFFNNFDRPSGTLQTDLELNIDQIKQLRQMFSESSKQWNQGGSPILTHGLKYNSVGVSQSDQQLIEQQKLSALDICRVFGVPYALVSDGQGAQGGTEAMISFWLSTGLGSIIESVERTLDKLFDLGVDERIELDPTPLLRVDQSSLYEFLGKGIQQGVLSPNEARAKIRLGKKSTGGDDLYLQRQMTSIDILSELNSADLGNKHDASPVVEDETVEEEPVIEESEKNFNSDYAKSLILNRLLEVTDNE